ncbi:MAG: DUF6421 family protein [Pseudoruegeria sp.]
MEASTLSYMSLDHSFIAQVESLGALQNSDGSIPNVSHDKALRLLKEIGPKSKTLAYQFGQPEYGKALAADFAAWITSGLENSPDLSQSRDALKPPKDGLPFFFTGPLRLANGGRHGWKMECFLALREEPDNTAYRDLYRMYPHPKNICQSAHLLSGTSGLITGNNIVFFPENIQSKEALDGQNYAVFFFNKFHDIYNKITLKNLTKATTNISVTNPTRDNPRATYLARCVWGYLHDYFHHQGNRPFDQHVDIKTRWFTGLLEEIKVDLQTWLTCQEKSFIDNDAVAEFIIFDRAFRYPSEPDWQRNFDSGTGLLLLSLLESENGLTIASDGRVTIDLEQLPRIAADFIAQVNTIEKLPDSQYLVAAKEMVRKYLPEGLQGQRIGLPNSLKYTEMYNLCGSATKPITFSSENLSSADAQK